MWLEKLNLSQSVKLPSVSAAVSTRGNFVTGKENLSLSVKTASRLFSCLSKVVGASLQLTYRLERESSAH